ncbi:synaptosomal-associated protein 29 [Phymastichus coffea]|uniref:synaptosomal-associated protein 29 n=1 Tax=Phymastichus coffea TaxID=108790 RepID=UPI00273B356B|nr:synaptosomal-associated protein 29 [Phymastichus coffea]XP_058810882.1 synaptosomal-associated protein 29 [Phymastichus coffea]
MAGNDYLRDPKNPFFSLEDDVDDETFLKSAPPRYPSTNPFQNYDNELEKKHQELVERKKEVEQRTLQSSMRSMSLLRDTEEVGTATAEELIRQREQLERTDRRLDDINNTLRFSQKHIQGIKSVFGGLKNYFSGSKSMDAPPGSSAGGIKTPESPLSPTSEANLADRLNKTAESARRNSEHPSFRLRGMTEEEEDIHPSTKNLTAVLEANLDEMSSSISRLKGLAIGLSEEIDTQNDLIDSITDKAEKADITLQRQNKDIRHLLKK